MLRTRLLLVLLFAFILPLGVFAESGPACADVIRDLPSSYTTETVSPKAIGKWAQFFEKVPKTPGLKVMWWNIAKGTLENDALSANLERLISSKIKPDVLLLGEFGSHALDIATIAELKRAYPYHEFVQYNSYITDSGIAVFSTKPFRHGREQTLQWIPSQLNAEETAEYRARWSKGVAEDLEDAFYTRTVKELQIDTPQGTVSILPIHLAQPWRSIRENSRGRIGGIAATVKEMFLGRKNPLIVQIDHLLEWIKSGNSSQKILIGDFNMPRGIFAIPTVGFGDLSGDLDHANLGSDSSFPTPSSPMIRSYIHRCKSITLSRREISD